MEDLEPIVIPILGMHRSGTSALAGALHKLGADLGRESSWLAPAADNPAGFFEYEPLVAVNRAILANMGGTWSSPPAFPPGWETSDDLAEERERALALAEDVSTDLVVKDPRMSLTFPLWASVTKLTGSVLCVRHPVSVAASLERRNGFTIEEGLFLWFRYNAASLLNVDDLLIVEYEKLVADPVVELGRVAEQMGLDVSQTALDLAGGSIRADMVHHDAAELPASPIGRAVHDLYAVLRDGSDIGEHDELFRWGQIVTELPWAGASDREVSLVRSENHRLAGEMEELRRERDVLFRRNRRLAAELRHVLHALDREAVAETAALLADLKDRR